VSYRFFTDEEHGEGYVDEAAPELAIAVVDGHRGRGVGKLLVEAIHARARADGVARSRSAPIVTTPLGGSTRGWATSSASRATRTT